MRAGVTEGEWRVPSTLAGEEAEYNGLVVTATTDAGETVLADCRNLALPLAQQRANATAMAAVPWMLRTLRECESFLGDLPRSRDAQRLHNRVCMTLAAAGVKLEAR